MRVLVQRVSSASVSVDDEVVGAVRPAGQGLLAFVGVTHSDTADTAQRLAEKLWHLRILDEERSAADSAPATGQTGSAAAIGAVAINVAPPAATNNSAKAFRSNDMAILIPWLILAFFALPVILVDLAVSAMLARCAGKLGQTGRGMLIGCISAPVSLVIFIPAIIIAHEIGPI